MRFCINCPLISAEGPVEVDATGKRLFVVVEKPNLSEREKKFLFVKLVSVASKVFGLSIKQAMVVVNELVSIVPVLRCIPGPGEIKPIEKKKAIECCKNYLLQDISKTKETVVVTLGSEALRAVFPGAPRKLASDVRGIRGRVIPLRDFCIVVAEDLQDVIDADFDVTRLFESDLEQAFRLLLKKPSLNLPEINICQLSQGEFVEQVLLGKVDVLAFDFETTTLSPHAKDAELYSVSFAWRDGGRIKSVVTKVEDKVSLSALFWQLLESGKRLVAHNLNFELRWLVAIMSQLDDKRARQFVEKLFVYVPQFDDTMLLEYIRCEFAPLSLKVLVSLYFGVGDYSVDVKDIRKLLLSDLLRYNALDAAYTLLLREEQLKVLQKDDNLRQAYECVYKQILLPGLFRLQSMVWPGVPFDEEKSKRLFEKFSKQRDDAEAKFRLFLPDGMKDLNMSSVPQLRRLFYVVKGYTPIVQKGRQLIEDMNARADEGSTSFEALQVLQQKYKDPLIENLVRYREASKIISTYIEGISRHATPSLFVKSLRAWAKLAGTVTGRLSFAEPNLQNFPKRELPEVRNVVKAPDRYVIVAFDQGQIEARFFAICSGDPAYIKALHEGYDIHAFFAKMAFAVTYADADKQEDAYIKRRIGVKKLEVVDKKTFKRLRSITKNSFTFPCLYNAGINTMQLYLNKSGRYVSKERIRLMQNELFSRFPRLKEFIKYVHDFYGENLFLRSLYWRLRRAPIAFTQRVNFVIQSSASDTVFTAGTVLSLFYFWLFFIHDDNTFLLPDDDLLEQRIDNIASIMIAYPWLFLSRAPRDLLKAYIPFEIEVAAGKRWGSLKEVKTISADDLGLNSIEDAVRATREYLYKAKELTPHYAFLP